MWRNFCGSNTFRRPFRYIALFKSGFEHETTKTPNIHTHTHTLTPTNRNLMSFRFVFALHFFRHHKFDNDVQYPTEFFFLVCFDQTVKHHFFIFYWLDPISCWSIWNFFFLLLLSRASWFKSWYRINIKMKSNGFCLKFVFCFFLLSLNIQQKKEKNCLF